MSRTRTMSLAFSAAILILIIVQYTLITSNRTFVNTLNKHVVQDKRLKQVYIVFGLVLDLETSSRGFMLTGSENFLGPHDRAERLLPDELAKLYGQISQQQYIELANLIAARTAQANFLIKKKIMKVEISFQDLQKGKQIMDELRNEIEIIKNLNSSNDESRDIIVQENSAFIFYLMIGGVAVSMLVVVGSLLAAISELRKRAIAEKQLELTLATSEAISNNVGLGVLVLQKNKIILFANQRFVDLTRFNMDEIKNISSETILRDLNLNENDVNLLLGTSDNYSQKINLKLKDELRTLKMMVSPLSVNGSNEGKIISFADITEETESIKELTTGKEVAIMASHAKSDFLAKMSHEIRTPLNAILGVGEIMNLSPLTKEQQKCMDIFERSSQTLNNLVNDILDLSKIEAGKLELNEVAFSLKNVVNTCTSIMDFRASQKGLLFNLNHLSTHDYFIGDEGRIRQVVLNLLGNAVKFTEEGSITLTIGCYPRENDQREVVISVADTGRGISEANIEKLFANYQQETNKISSEYGGTGLGLSLSRELALLMNGNIEVHSVLGKGSDFVFNFFVKVSHVPLEKVVIDESIPLKKMKILLVDDNPENRFIINRFLKGTEVEIVEAYDGLKAYEKFQEDKFDIILMDINMPVMDGITATTKIREYEKSCNLNRTIIIALSANALSQEYSKAMEAGCDDYLTKPLPRIKLFTTIQRWQRGLNPVANQNLQVEETLEEIDEEILAMIPQYLDNRKKDLVVIDEAMKNKDLQILNRIGHNISGTAESYGQSELSRCAKKFYQAVKNEEWTEMAVHIKTMKKIIG